VVGVVVGTPTPWEGVGARMGGAGRGVAPRFGVVHAGEGCSEGGAGVFCIPPASSSVQPFVSPSTQRIQPKEANTKWQLEL
jgi:hypothetical protein